MSEISNMYNVEELAKYIGLNYTPKSWYIAYKEIKDNNDIYYFGSYSINT